MEICSWSRGMRGEWKCAADQNNAVRAPTQQKKLCAIKGLNLTNSKVHSQEVSGNVFSFSCV